MVKQFASENLPPHVQDIADTMNVEMEKIPPFKVPSLPFDNTLSPALFLNKKRQELRKGFEEKIFGYIPPRCDELIFKITSEGPAFENLAIRREIDIICRHKGMERILHLLLYIPANAKGRVPVFFGLNFKGNHACTGDTGVTFHPFDRYPALIPGSLRLADGRAAKEERGLVEDRWHFEKALKEGFATATMCYFDVYPDHPHGFEKSIMKFFYTKEEWESPDRDTGAICAWAWGLMRGIDCLETQKELNMDLLTVHGHSRLGKTALLTGSYDPRIALTVSNGSGACGIKMMHHHFGENFGWVQYWNPHWFRGNFAEMVNKEQEMDFDFHFLAASIAPRLLYVSDGNIDTYADPEGSFLTCKEASKAWQLFGATGLGEEEYPPCGKLCGQEIGYYLRKGDHAFTGENWDMLIQFAKKHFC